MSHSIIAMVDNLDCLNPDRDPFNGHFPWPDHIQALGLTDSSLQRDPRCIPYYCTALTLANSPITCADTALLLRAANRPTLTLPLADNPADDGVAPAKSLLHLADWLAGPAHRWWLIPWPLVAVCRALFNIYTLDPYLGAHYARQLSNILSGIAVEQWLVTLSKDSEPTGNGTQNNHFSNQFWQFEKKIVRQYATHP